MYFSGAHVLYAKVTCGKNTTVERKIKLPSGQMDRVVGSESAFGRAERNVRSALTTRGGVCYLKESCFSACSRRSFVGPTV